MMRIGGGTQADGSPLRGLPRTTVEGRRASRHVRVSSYLVKAATLYCFLLPLDVLPLVGTISIGFPGMLLLLIAWSNDRLSGRRAPTVAAEIGTVAFALLAWSALTILWSAAPSVTTIGVASMALQMLTVVALVSIVPSHWSQLTVAYAHGAAILATFLLAAPPVAERANRANVAGIDENVTAFVLTLGCAAISATLIRAGGIRTLWGLAEFGIMAAAVMHGGSRTGFVALVGLGVVGLVHAVIMAGSHGGRVALRGFAAGSLVVPTYLVARSRGLIPERVLAIVEGAGLEDDSLRAVIVQFFLFFQDDWFWKGIGYSADAEFLQQSTGLYKNVHSLFWATWVGLGLIGLLLFAVLLALCLRNALRLPTRMAVIFMAVPIAAFGLTLGGDRTSAFWFPIALAAVNPKVAFGRSGNRNSQGEGPGE